MRRALKAIACAGAPERRTRSVGAAGRGVDTALYRARGLDAIPSRGPLAANTVAGTVSSWKAAHDVAQRWGGTLPLAALLEDAIHYARAGVPVTRLPAMLPTITQSRRLSRNRCASPPTV